MTCSNSHFISGPCVMNHQPGVAFSKMTDSFQLTWEEFNLLCVHLLENDCSWRRSSRVQRPRSIVLMETSDRVKIRLSSCQIKKGQSLSLKSPLCLLLLFEKVRTSLCVNSRFLMEEPAITVLASAVTTFKIYLE